MSFSAKHPVNAGVDPNRTPPTAQRPERTTRMTEIVYALFVMATGILLLATAV